MAINATGRSKAGGQGSRARRSTVRRAGGFEKFIEALEGDDEIRNEVNDAARAVRRYAQQLIRGGSKGGETYRARGKDRKWIAGSQHRASAPGEAPADMTGTLADRVTARLARKGKGTRRVAFVIPRAPHAHLLEYGTVNMAARPFLGPAVQTVQGQFASGMRAAARHAIDKAAKKAQREIQKKGFIF